MASEERGLRLVGQQLRVDSGGVLELDRLELVVGELVLNDFGVITATGKVGVWVIGWVWIVSRVGVICGCGSSGLMGVWVIGWVWIANCVWVIRWVWVIR